MHHSDRVRKVVSRLNKPNLAQVEERFTAVEVVHDEIQTGAILESVVQFHQEWVGDGLHDLFLRQRVLHLISVDDHLLAQYLPRYIYLGQ